MVKNSSFDANDLPGTVNWSTKFFCKYNWTKPPRNATQINVILKWGNIIGTIHVADSLKPTDHSCFPFFEKQSSVLFIQTTIMVCSMGKIDSPIVGLSNLVICRPSNQDFRRMQIDPSLECNDLKKMVFNRWRGRIKPGTDYDSVVDIKVTTNGNQGWCSFKRADSGFVYYGESLTIQE